MSCKQWTLFTLLLTTVAASSERFTVRDDLHFHPLARATNKDGSLAVYKNPTASIEDRVNDLLPRMTLEEKVSQLYVPSTLLPMPQYLTLNSLAASRAILTGG